MLAGGLAGPGNLMSTAIDEARPLSRKKRFLFALIVCSFFVLVCLCLSEVILRKKGLGPWSMPKPYLSIAPAGNYYTPDAKRGYLLRPGELKITLPGHYSFKVTHLSNGLRITHPLDTYSEKPKKEVWIFGCSLTHGWSLNDEQTYPWLLQEEMPGYEVINFGAEGYSTLQSLIQFQQALEKGQRPALVILAYGGSIHDYRNTLTRSWMKLRMPGRGYVPGGISLPYLKWSPDKQPELLYKPLDYHGVPLLHYSAFANFLDDTYNRLLEKTYHSHEVSKVLIEDFASLCKANGTEFVVAGIYSTPETTEMLEYLNRKGVMTVDISVDLNIRENTNLPYDNHPSALANQKYARKLDLFLCSKSLAGRRL
jgi:hypothetical protein